MKSSLVSDVLGWGLTATAAFSRLPQLLAVLQLMSAEGLSVVALELETLAGAILVAYYVDLGHPLAAYGENVVLFAQNVATLGLVYHLSGRVTRRGLPLLLAVAAVRVLQWWCGVLYVICYYVILLIIIRHVRRFFENASSYIKHAW